MDRAPLTLLIAARPLTGAMVELPAANRITLGLGGRLSLWFEYTRHASGAGIPVVRLEGSAAPPDTDPAAITEWTPYPALDLSTFSAGRITANALEVGFGPSAATIRARLPDIDVLDLTFARLLVMDTDATNFGTLTVRYRLVVL